MMRQYVTSIRPRAAALALSLLLGVSGLAFTNSDVVAQPRMSTPVSDEPTRTPEFDAWIANFRTEALAQGISAKTFDQAFSGVKLNQRVIELNENQPEFNRAVWDYMDSAVNDDRIKRGRQLLKKNRKTLHHAEREYGVPASLITAIWGLESRFGEITGGFNVIEALATLAFEGRRAAFGKEQLLAALKILEAGDIPPSRMTGSWAGAMGQTQFIPTVFLQYARDGNGDGHRNLWDTLSDVFASTANYLKEKGWQEDDPCFDEVRLPDKFDYASADISIEKPVSAWIEMGVVRVDGRPLPKRVRDDQSAIILPAGHSGPAFIAYPNFKAVLAYNNAVSYALAICQLANRFEKRPPIKTPWPRDEAPLLSRADRTELQTLLAQRNYDVGEPDGVIGRRTREAIRAYQASVGLVPDGYATVALLVRLRQPS